jgi:hypothetical protein
MGGAVIMLGAAETVDSSAISNESPLIGLKLVALGVAELGSGFIIQNREQQIQQKTLEYQQKIDLLTDL